MTENLIAFISAVIISFVMTPLARRLAIRVHWMFLRKQEKFTLSRCLISADLPYMWQ
jgi:UDP-N-acetylmuramyl pentapeptide phosphotransferase/UDP-N-acetylglucosamine-1-phosphate transferase